MHTSTEIRGRSSAITFHAYKRGARVPANTNTPPPVLFFVFLGDFILPDAIATGKKRTVLLQEGDFYLCETLVGVNFDGTFKGAGAGATVLHSIENFPALDTGGLGIANPRMMMFYQDEYSTSTAEDPYKMKLCDFSFKVD